MFTYLRALVNWVKGWFGGKTDALQENRHVMAATYDSAIASRKQRLATVKNAVANLIGVEQERTAQVKELGTRLETLGKIKTGAQTAMQRRIDALKAAGKAKEDILSDAEFIKHKAAFEDASSTMSEVQERFDEKDADLKKIKKDIANYKAELQTMQRQNDALSDEKNEALADVGIAQQREAVNAALAGIPQDTADADLEKARQARKRVVNRAAVTAELAGNDAKNAESEYLKYADAQAANTELDNLLNWGDEKKEGGDTLSPAKLPE